MANKTSPAKKQIGEKDKKVDEQKSNSKYLNEMKELPGEEYYEEDELKEEKEKLEKMKEDGNKKKKNKELKAYRKISVISKTIIALGVVNLLFIIGLGYLIGNLPKKAEELKNVRNLKLQASSAGGDTTLADTEIENSAESVDKMKSLFPNDSGLVGFVRQVEAIKADGTIKEFSFASITAVTDTTGNYGIPFTISLEGSWVQIGDSMAKIQKIPYLFRTTRVKSKRVEDEEGNLTDVIQLEYRGFLYVDESLGQD